ncbi:MAG: hypothetical protein KDC12_13595 [Flavobacteriales bacterium]|nr:hypothetical protein [Flavobacteriales bacterium]
MQLIRLALIASIMLSFVHKYYVSSTRMEFNPQSGSFEITMKIFTDDLERTLRSTFDDELQMELGVASRELNYHMEDYLRQHFEVIFDDVPTTWSYVGMEVEMDRTFIYLELPRLLPFSEMKVRNTCLFDSFEKQSNIIDIVYQGKSKKLVLYPGFDHDSYFY